MNIREANEAGLITVGRRVKTDANGIGKNRSPFTGRITKVFKGHFKIARDDGPTGWRIEFDNTEAQIVMLDTMSFKKGDFVKLATSKTVTNGTASLLNSENIFKGRTYVVDEYGVSGIKIRGTPMHYWHDEENFVLVSSPSKTKEDSKGESVMESSNTKSVSVNDTIGEVLGEKSYNTVMLVNKWFGEEIPNNFTGKMLLEDKKDKFIKEAEDREKESLKEAAKK